MLFLLNKISPIYQLQDKKNFFEKEKPVWIGNFSGKIAEIFKKSPICSEKCVYSEICAK